MVGAKSHLKENIKVWNLVVEFETIGLYVNMD
jgi:hypothetical protein